MSHHEVHPAELDIREVTHTAGDREVLSRVSLTAAPGEVVGVVGPNGAGKSTLLRTAYRQLRPTHGRVLLDGTDVFRTPRRSLARRLAALPQELPAEFELTAHDVAAMGRTPHRRRIGRDRLGDERIVTVSLEMVEMAELAHRSFDQLSGGEKQRVLIARALAQEPGMLVLDEPTNHLDMRHQFDVLALVRRLNVTTLAALHDLNLAARFCDRMCVLAAGEVAAIGTPAEVLTESLLSEVYGVRAEIGTHPRTGAPTVLFGN
ncbi:iron complex transport system ATP-binding protein [Actinopolyspora xinjiangensis]|uniref:Iron complex transport system ATP-binding protein n=1 Tax=Actinopolyspora xinjiangensis TaxID=405564 RepID=A0A1H0WYN9_9ACTN|nr:ABC transporter ATP-binding protein [Actinopolyspora xinjiangensis]SDP95854.1 iron complex transport system ATP-binding protein [Actinopolyspora xinjiangensis]